MESGDTMTIENISFTRTGLKFIKNFSLRFFIFFVYASIMIKLQIIK